MTKFLAFLALGLLLACSAYAVLDPDPNSLGLYFDLNADEVCIAPAETGETFAQIQAYLILVNPTFDFLKGLECRVDSWGGTCTFTDLILPTVGVNVGDLNNIYLGFRNPLRTSQATLVATFDVFVSLDGEDIFFTLGAAEPPSIEGDYPVVVDGLENMFQVGMSVPPGNYCARVSMAGHCGVIATETRSWGSIKSLYR